MPRWSSDEDAKLLGLHWQGLSYFQISLLMPGESRVAIINRRHRISGTEFLSQIARKEVEREARQKKQKEDLVSDRRIVNIIQNLASNGSGREDTIAQALRIGATLDQVGRALGISRQCVHQIRKRNRMTETSKD